MSAMILEVSARIGAAIAAAAGSHGPAVCAAVGFDPARASDPDARIPLELETALWDEAARATGDDAFGLHAAEQVRPGAFDVLDYAIRTAPTFRASFDRLARYNRLVHDAAVFTVTDDATRTRVEHARRFGVAPRFGAAVNAIEYDRALIEQPLASADPALSSVIERHAEALLAARPEPVETTANRARRLLGAMLGEGEVSLASVAQRLHMSERTLQRHLAAENVTFDALLDELRRDLALRYLADAKLAIAEVAYLLGYSEPSAFHRAFKRWTGETPAEARRSAEGGPG